MAMRWSGENVYGTRLKSMGMNVAYSPNSPCFTASDCILFAMYRRSQHPAPDQTIPWHTDFEHIFLSLFWGKATARVPLANTGCLDMCSMTLLPHKIFLFIRHCLSFRQKWPSGTKVSSAAPALSHPLTISCPFAFFLWTRWLGTSVRKHS